MTIIAPPIHTHNHHTTEKKPSGLRKKFKKIGDFFKGTDGWDELGSGIGQTLPGIGQHIATASVLSILTPFVYLGVKGMASEMDEAKEDLHQIQDAKKELLEKMNDILGLNLSPDALKGIKTIEDIAKNLKHRVGDTDFEEKAHLFTRYAQNLVEEKTAKIANSATPYGLTAMTGMLGGMVAATLRSGAEIASTAQPTIHALETTALALEIATAGMFIPAQIAMMIYAGKKVDEGKIIRNKLNHDKTAVALFEPQESILKKIEDKLSPQEQALFKELKENSESQASKEDIFKDTQEGFPKPSLEISENFYNAIQDNLDRKLHYNNLGKIVYGRGLAISEAGMVVGAALGLAPIANTIAPAILVPSAVATIGFAGLRIYAQNKEGKFTGQTHDHVHDGSISHAWKNTSKRIYKGLKNKFSRKKDTYHPHNHHHDHHHEHTAPLYQHNPKKEYETEFNEFTQDLAEQKLNSLMLHSLSFKKPEEALEKMVKTGRKSFFKRTTLQKDVLKEMQDIFSDNKEENNNLNEIFSDTKKLHQIITNIFGIDNQNSQQRYMKTIENIHNSPKLRQEFGKICKKYKRNNPFEKDNSTDLQDFERAWNDPKILKAFCKPAIAHEKNKAKQKRQEVIDEVVFQANVKSLQAKAENFFNHRYHH